MLKILLILLIVLVLIVVLANYIVENATSKKIYNELENIPEKYTALILGTVKELANGLPNWYFVYRIEAAANLYKAGKVKRFVLSGDNSRKGYNEPEDMKAALIEKGVPENIIYLDYAGFRTYDSVYRMQAIFGQEDFIIVSQKFHNQRAIYLAQHLGLKAIGYNAKDVAQHEGLKTKIREKFARVKVFKDVLLKPKPKFLGDKIYIE